jgi:glutathione peroxidase
MTDTRLTDIALTTLDGTPTTLAQLADGAVLLVNVASKCGLTPQYSALEKLAKEYGGRGLTVIGVPCNQFMGQEPARGGDPDVLLHHLRSHLSATGQDGCQRAGRHPLFAELTKTADASERRAMCSGTSKSSCSRRVAWW